MISIPLHFNQMNCIFQTAVTVLEGLLDENEDDAQLWYMIGWANFLQGEDYKSNARYYLKKCKEVSQRNPLFNNFVVSLYSNCNVKY